MSCSRESMAAAAAAADRIIGDLSATVLVVGDGRKAGDQTTDEAD